MVWSIQLTLVLQLSTHCLIYDHLNPSIAGTLLERYRYERHEHGTDMTRSLGFTFSYFLSFDSFYCAAIIFFGNSFLHERLHYFGCQVSYLVLFLVFFRLFIVFSSWMTVLKIRLRVGAAARLSEPDSLGGSREESLGVLWVVGDIFLDG